MTEFMKWNFSEFSFLSRYRYVLNRVEAFYFILNMWERKFNYDKDSRHVSPITDRQNVQARRSTDILLLLFCYPMLLADHLFTLLYVDDATDSVVKYK
jgi:hypothetical protein